MYKNRKAVTEITTFVLITLLVVISSISAYVIAKEVLDRENAKLDVNNLKATISKFDIKLSEIQNFDNSSFSLNFHFNTGELRIIDNQIYFQSFKNYEGLGYCDGIFCSEPVGGKERIKYNLSDGYTFDKNFSLIPESYMLTFTNLKNEKKIHIKFS